MPQSLSLLTSIFSSQTNAPYPFLGSDDRARRHGDLAARCQDLGVKPVHHGQGPVGWVAGLRVCSSQTGSSPAAEAGVSAGSGVRSSQQVGCGRHAKHILAGCRGIIYSARRRISSSWPVISQRMSETGIRPEARKSSMKRLRENSSPSWRARSASRFSIWIFPIM